MGQQNQELKEESTEFLVAFFFFSGIKLILKQHETATDQLLYRESMYPLVERQQNAGAGS